MRLTRGGYLAVGLMLALACTSYVLERSRQPVDWTGRDAVTITLTKQGFRPQYVYITRGTNVTFNSTAGTQFWPASDLHPTHAILPIFDARRPVPPDESWSFTFTKDGHWNFHDHIGLMTGAVIVVPPGERGDPRYDKLAPCDEAELAGRQACWKEHITFAFDKEGLPGALAEMTSLYELYPEFANQCHGFAHDIGLSAYEKYGERIPISEATLICGQGFYHGYMEKFLAVHRGDTVAAVRFCARVGKTLSDSQIAGPQCLHGIGHGTMEYFLSTRPDLMGQLSKMVSLALDECAKMPDDDGRFRCASGVYAVMKDWINIQGLAASYADLFSLKDPFVLCRLRPEAWETRACAWEMAKQAYTLARFEPSTTFTAELRAARSWDGGEHLPTIITSTGFLIGELGVTKSDRELVKACDAIDDTSLHQACTVGIMLGLVFNADPTDTITRPLRFCMNSDLPSADRDACLKQLVYSTSDAWGDEAHGRICERIATPLSHPDPCNKSSGRGQQEF